MPTKEALKFDEVRLDIFVVNVKKYISSVKEICTDLDFSNLSFFGKFVKEHLGMSPTEYWQRNLREGQPGEKIRLSSAKQYTWRFACLRAS